jgi:hypothetical protein
MKTEAGARGMVPTVLYFVAGIFWAGVLVAGGGILLFWPALTCFLSGVILMTWASSRFTRPLVNATSLFGLALTIYQLAVALTLIGTGLDPIAGITAVLFGVMTVVYLFLLFTGMKKKGS